jgi:hypothetical protein
MLMLADVQTSSFTDGMAAGFTLYVGTNPQPQPCSSGADTVCRHHLQGTGTFSVAATPRDLELVGNFASGTLTTTSGGHLPVQVSLGAGHPFTIELIGARAKITATTTNITAGVAAGGVTQNDMNTKIFPALAAVVMGEVTASCTNLSSPPGCGCTTGSAGATSISLFDTNHDCAVSTQEVMGNAIIQTLFAPDVMLEGQTCLSVGVGFTAVSATYTP